jgi:sugar lactone lactonase YvrE
MAEPLGKRVLRVNRGGSVIEELSFDTHPTAVTLGGADRRTLFVCLAPHIDHGRPRDRADACIVAVRVGEPGIGKP